MDNKITYQQLMLLPNDELTVPQKDFLDVHNEMVMAGQKATECLLIVANDMKRMRDEKLYEAAGFETFKDYVETTLNIKERQAYNWISILNLPEAYLTKNAGMGVTKLTLIASASESVADELMNDESTSEKSVRELTAIIKEREEALERKDQQMSIMSGELDGLRKKEVQLELLQGEEERHKDAEKVLLQQLEEAQANLEEANGKLKESEAKIKELNRKKKEVVEKIVEVEKKVEVENPETKAKLEKAQNDLSAAEAAAEQAKAEKVEAEEKAKNAETELANYKKTQEAVATFKVHAANLFETFEAVMNAVWQIKATDPALAKKCLGKLIEFCDNIQYRVEELQQ